MTKYMMPALTPAMIKSRVGEAKYHPLGEMTKEQFEELARDHETRTHTYLSDGDRGHKVWAFYSNGFKFVCDGIRYGYWSYRELPPNYQDNGDGTFSMDW